MVSVHSGGLGVFGGGESAGERTALGVCLARQAFHSSRAAPSEGPAASPVPCSLGPHPHPPAPPGHGEGHAFGTKSQDVFIGCVHGPAFLQSLCSSVSYCQVDTFPGTSTRKKGLPLDPMADPWAEGVLPGAGVSL